MVATKLGGPVPPSLGPGLKPPLTLTIKIQCRLQCTARSTLAHIKYFIHHQAKIFIFLFIFIFFHFLFYHLTRKKVEFYQIFVIPKSRHSELAKMARPGIVIPKVNFHRDFEFFDSLPVSLYQGQIIYKATYTVSQKSYRTFSIIS